MIQLQHITKRFANIPALEDVSLTIRPNQIHGLLGENGAGKSTLMNILFGLLTPDAGSILIHNTPVKINSPRTAHSLGIGMVHQHFKLVPTLTTLENLALALHTSAKKIRPAAQQLMEQLHWPVPLNARIDALAVGQQQRIEILKALLAIRPSLPPQPPVLSPQSFSPPSPSLLILDEPTAVLTPQESAELFTALQTLKSPAKGNTAIIFISHKLAEIQHLCDHITILRRGKLIVSAPASDLTAKQITEKMVGAAIELPHRPLPPQSSVLSPQSSAVPSVLRLSHLSAGQLKSINLQIPPGQILGIAGVDGNGQADLAAAIVGALPITRGTLTLKGLPANHLSIRQRSEFLAYIPEDRHLQALVLPFSITQNLLLKDYRRKPYSTAGFLRFNTWRKHAHSLIQQFDIRCRSESDPAARLSGGNQQKLVLARELAANTKPLILAVNPTRGLDIGATAFVMNQLLTARQNGAAILLIHSDLDELLALADQVSVLYNGTLTPSPTPTKNSIAPLMLGLTQTSEPVA